VRFIGIGPHVVQLEMIGTVTVSFEAPAGNVTDLSTGAKICCVYASEGCEMDALAALRSARLSNGSTWMGPRRSTCDAGHRTSSSLLLSMPAPVRGAGGGDDLVALSRRCQLRIDFRVRS
jgi:hypothetical protein